MLTVVEWMRRNNCRLCERSISEFNAKINEQHLAECIMRLLNLYDEFEDKKNSLELDSDMKKLMLNDDRPQMEALYILLHMGNTEALMRGLQLPLDLRYEQNRINDICLQFICSNTNTYFMSE